MAVTPLSTPLKTEYKPLGLEAFAKPLSDMQAKYDTKLEEIQAADFALSRLSQDDPRAKELLTEIESKTDELASNLMNTGNYRQASLKLLELNKAYNKNEETNAIKANYESYQKAVKEQKERVAKGDITQKDYDLWDFRVKHSFKGTGYDKDTDTYSSINVHPRMKNMEKELREESLKIAGMLPAQIKEFLDRNQVDAFTQERIQTLISERKLEQGAREIEQFLKTSDQYKNWIQEDADYKWYYYTNTDPNYSENYLNSVVNEYDNKISQYEQFLSDPKKAQSAQAQIDKLQQDRSTLVNYANQANEQGNLQDFAKTVFFNQAQGRLGATAYAASDIVDMQSVTMDVADKTDEGKKGKADNAIKKLEEVGSIGTNLAASTGVPGATIVSGTATNTAAENIIVNYSKDAFSMMKSTNIDSVPDLKDKSLKIAVSPNEEKTFNETLENSKDLHVTLGRMNNFNKELKNQDSKIKLKKEELAKASSSEEKKKLSQELTDMYQNKEELTIALTDDTRTFDNIIDAEINAPYVTPELKKLYDAEYQNNPIKFLTTLREHSNKFLEAQSNVGAAEETLKLELERNQQIKDAIANAENQNIKLTEEDILKRFPITTPKLTVPQDDFTMLANNIMNKYKWNLYSKFDAIGSEVIMNKNLDAMTDGAVTDIVDYVKQNTRGKSDVKKVTYNMLTGKTQEDPEGNKFDLKGCYNETPHFAGVDKNGDIILRYVLNSDFDPETKTAKTAIANYIKTQKGIPETKTYTPTDEEVATFRKANPTDLYISVKGRSKQLTETATKNYTEIAEAGIAYNDGEVITQNLNNYAPIHLGSNAERKENYYKMAARLKDAVDNDHKFTEIVQGPAAWNANEDGSYTAYQITYKVVDRQVQAQINKGIMKNGKTSWSPLTVKTLESMGQNLPTALVAMDLTYGTGREEDLVNTQRGFDTTIFVPAFENPGIATQEGFRRYSPKTGKWVQH